MAVSHVHVGGQPLGVDASASVMESKAMLWAYRTVPVLASLAVAVASFALSFVALQEVAVETRAVSPALAWLVPIVIDGGILCASAVIWAQAALAQRRSYFPMVVVAVLVAISVVVNAAHAGPSVLAKVIAALPPLVLLATLELVALSTRRAQVVTGAGMAPAAVVGQVSAASGVVAGPSGVVGPELLTARSVDPSVLSGGLVGDGMSADVGGQGSSVRAASRSSSSKGAAKASSGPARKSATKTSANTSTKGASTKGASKPAPKAGTRTSASGSAARTGAARTGAKGSGVRDGSLDPSVELDRILMAELEEQLDNLDVEPVSLPLSEPGGGDRSGLRVRAVPPDSWSGPGSS